jgi:hypothetical protein
LDEQEAQFSTAADGLLCTIQTLGFQYSITEEFANLMHGFLNALDMLSILAVQLEESKIGFSETKLTPASSGWSRIFQKQQLHCCSPSLNRDLLGFTHSFLHRY